MALSEEVRKTHRDLSAIDLEFRELAHEDPRFLDRSHFQPLTRENELLAYRLQPWLTFLGRDKLQELQRVSLGMYRLLQTLPMRIFEGDLNRLQEFYGFPSPFITEIVMSPPNGIDTIISRGDLIDTADGFKCIEFNFSPHLGGWESPILAGLHLSVPATAEFLSSRGIPVAYTDTVQKLFRLVIRDVMEKGISRDGEINVGFLIPTTDPVESTGPKTRYFDGELQRALAEVGGGLSGRVVAGNYASLSTRDNLLFSGGLRLHAAIDLTIGGNTQPAVFRSFKSSNLSLFNGPVGPVLGTKRNLALLSEHAGTSAFSDEEREFIRRYIPWTRLVVPGSVEFEGRSAPLDELLVARRERMVLKEGGSAGGKGVFLGKFTPEPEWREAIATAMQSRGQWVVQEHFESLPYLYQSGDHGASVHDVIWGPFVFGGEYAGVILRMQPRAAGGAVNLSLAATEGVVFEV
ncbi:MAG TPA: hypothetical protein VEL74_02225 [Thermoanaerobaculia bacterium]|nr:hypothetical protein [Thermoanaerobaculia bacterium]